MTGLCPTSNWKIIKISMLCSHKVDKGDNVVSVNGLSFAAWEMSQQQEAPQTRMKNSVLVQHYLLLQTIALPHAKW